MSITPFTLQGKNFILDTEQRKLTGDDEAMLDRIHNRIEQCRNKGMHDDYPTGGMVDIDNPYGDDYQFAVCLFATPESISPDAEYLGIPSESLRKRLYSELLTQELNNMSAEDRLAYYALRDNIMY